MALDTKDRQSRELNPAQRLHNQETDFASIASNYHRTADGANEEAAIDRAKSHLDQHGDTVANNYNADDPEDNREDIANQENNPDAPQNPDSFYSGPDSKPQTGKSGRINSFIKNLRGNKGATGGIVGLLIGSFGIGTIGLSPMALMTSLSTITSNHTDMGNRLYTKTSNSFIAAFIKGGDRDCSTSKIKCKFTTISDERKKKWEARGIKVDAAPSAIPGVTGGTRWKVRGLEFPTGTKVTSMNQYNNLRSIDSTAASLLKRFPIRASYLNQKSAINKSLSKFSTSLGDKFKSSSDRDKEERQKANAEAMNSKTGAVTGEDGKVTPDGVKKKIDDKTSTHTSAAKEKMKGAKAVAAGAGSIAAPVVAACMAYDVVRATQAAIMLAWHTELIKFAVPFIQAGSQAKEAGVNGEFDWETAEYYGDRLTQPVTQKAIDESPDDNITQDMLGKTAMDSKGFAAALNGDAVINENYSGWAPIKDVMGSEIITDIQNTVGGGNTSEGKQTIRTSCIAASYIAYLGLAQCLNPVGAVKCLAFAAIQTAAVQVFGDEIVEKIAEIIAEPAINTMAKANLSDSLVGPPLGDAVVSGAGIMATYMDRSSGFAIAGSPAQAQQAYLDTINDQDYLAIKTADKKEEARKNQFDPNNSMSFAGQIATRIASVPFDGTGYSVFASLTNTVANLPLTAKASALKQGVYQPIEVYQSPEKFTGAMNNCTSPGLSEAEIPCLGESGRTVPVLMSPVKECIEDEMKEGSTKICIEEAIDFLSQKKYKDEEDNEQPYISETTGEPSEMDKYNKDEVDYKNPFLMYMRHCGDDREFPIGYTDQPIDGDNPDWYEGIACAANKDSKVSSREVNDSEDKTPTVTDSSGSVVDNTTRAWMSYYYNECIALLASEEDQDYCWDYTIQPAAAVTPTGGDWVIPTSGPCLSPYGMRWGSPHQGIDISPPSGTPIVAPVDMTITFAGVNSGGYGNMVTGKATDGSEYSFRFGHMLSQPPVKVGQQVAKGTEIGKVGSTGNSTGPHLHFEIFPPGGNPATFSGAIDPVPVLSQHGVNISC